MFGGLDLKGSSDSKKEEKSDAATASASETTPSSSAFSFLNGMTSSTEQAAAPSSGSAFNFMNSTAPSQETPEVPEPTTVSGSGFSFLSPGAAPPQTESGGSATATEAPPAANSSSFSFLQASTVSSVPTPLREEAPNPLPAQDATAASGFSFLSASDTVSTVSRDSSEPSDAGPADLLTNPASGSGSTPHAPVGSGVVFGGATASSAAKKPIKRRTRTKVGVGATNAAASMRPPLPTATTAPATAATPTMTRDAAVEATRRAEEFMSEKIKQQVTSGGDDKEEEEDRSSSFHPPTIPKSSVSDNTSIKSGKSSDEDDIVAAAKAAAEEAQHIAHQKARSSFGLGGLFRSRRSPSPPRGTVESSATAHHSAGNSRPPVPTASQTAQQHIKLSSESVGSASSAKEVTPAERLQREQEEAKRAMAERQLEMIKQNDKPSTTTSATLTAEATPPPQVPSRPISVIPVPQVKKKEAAPPPKQIVIPKPKTPTEEFYEMMDDFQSKVLLSMEEVTRLRQQRIGLLEERFVTTAKERLAIQQKEQAEAQQMVAAEAEDFELADRLGAVIESHERERVEFTSFLESLGKAIQQLDSQKELVVTGVSNYFRDIQSKLRVFQEEQDSKETQDAADALKKFSRISKQLSAEHERLEQDFKHIERDEKLVAEESSELEVAISEQSGEIEKLRDETKGRLQDVENEIEDLRKLLAAKQDVAAQLRTEVAGHEESILKVRVKFSRQIDRVKKKKSTIQDNREEWELEKNIYERHKEEHDAKVKAHSEALIAQEQLLDTLAKEVEMAETFESIVAKEMSFGVAPKEDEELDDELAHLQAEVVKCEAALTESKEVLKAATAALTKLEDEVKSLEFSIPQLEELKKSAASRRDFKAAGKASKEIKEAVARLKECQEELEGDATERKAAAEKEVKDCEILLEDKRKVANEKEKKSGVAAMGRLADNVKRLVATKNSVCGKAEPNTIQGVGSFVLEGQINALLMEGQAYGDKYGGWDELIADCRIENSPASEETPANAEPKSSDEQSPDVEEAEEKKLDPESKKTDAVEDEKRPNGAEESKEEKERSMQKFRELTQRLKQAEDSIEEAVAKENYEEAAELDERLQKLLAEVQALSLTDEEMELALSSPSDADDLRAVDKVDSEEPQCVTSDEKVELEVSSADSEVVETADAEIKSDALQDTVTADDTQDANTDEVETPVETSNGAGEAKETTNEESKKVGSEVASDELERAPEANREQETEGSDDEVEMTS